MEVTMTMTNQGNVMRSGTDKKTRIRPINYASSLIKQRRKPTPSTKR